MMINYENASISFRIGVELWMNEERFIDLINMFDKYKGCTPQISLFTSETHPPLPLNVIEKRTTIMKERIRYAKKRNYSCGINVLSTIGHHNENLGGSLSGDMNRMTNIDGEVCWGSFCANGEKIRDYIRDLYIFVARAEPDFIWIDDDIRFAHKPIGNGCFCDRCLEIFKQETGISHSRESLKTAFNYGAYNNKLKIREKWLEHNRSTISRLLKFIEKTVHDIDPHIVLGFMTGERYFEGYGFKTWAEDLAGDPKLNIMWRPGGGVYNDDRLKGFMEKSHAIGRQISLLPDNVFSIQSEIENFPYQLLKKGPAETALEAASHIASGCTGAAFNVLPLYTEAYSVFEPLVEKIFKTVPFYRLLVESLEKEKPYGICTGWSINSQIACCLDNGNWTSGNPAWGATNFANELFELGLPAAYSQEYAQVILLSRDNVNSLSPDIIRSILSKGVYLEPEALDALCGMGYGHLIGFRVKEYKKLDCIEQYTENRVNAGGISGGKRNGRQAFHEGTVAALEPTEKKSQILSKIIDYSGNTIADCCMGLYENSLGGRICVSAYYPWTFVQDSLKSRQLKKIFRWLSGDTLLSYVHSFSRIYNWSRKLKNGKIVVVMINASLDHANDLVLKVNSKCNSCIIYDMQCQKTNVNCIEDDSPYKSFIIPDIKPWEMCLCIIG